MPSEMPPNRWKQALIWLPLYVVVLGAVIGGLFYGRAVALRTYGSAEAQREWDDWREDAIKMSSGEGPVTRRTPKSAQPPALILMRDYFAVCMAIGVVLSTVLFGTVVLFINGVMSTPAFVDRSLPERRR